MNKAELIAAVSQNSGMDKKTTGLVINAFLAVVTDTVKTRGSVKLTGFGTFTTRQRNARCMRSPKTGEKIQIPAIVVPHFKAGKLLREEIAGKQCSD